MQPFESHHAEQLNKLVSELCKHHTVNVYSIASRRSSDVLTFSIWGDRKAVLKMPSLIQEQLFDEDIEILQSGRRGINYVLIFVLTQRISRQPVAATERRAKLLKRAKLHALHKSNAEPSSVEPLN